jgi:hypothetical protein
MMHGRDFEYTRLVHWCGQIERRSGRRLHKAAAAPIKIR